MKKVNIKVIGTEEHINEFTNHFTNEQIVSMTGKFQNNENEKLHHRFMSIDLDELKKVEEVKA